MNRRAGLLCVPTNLFDCALGARDTLEEETNMKTGLELRDLTGVTKKALRVYAKYDLLHPVKKNKSGYWLFEDDASERIEKILNYQECGFKLKDIKRLLDDPAVDIADYVDREIERLLNEKEKVTRQLLNLYALKERL